MESKINLPIPKILPYASWGMNITRRIKVQFAILSVVTTVSGKPRIRSEQERRYRIIQFIVELASKMQRGPFVGIQSNGLSQFAMAKFHDHWITQSMSDVSCLTSSLTSGKMQKRKFAFIAPMHKYRVDGFLDIVLPFSRFHLPDTPSETLHSFIFRRKRVKPWYDEVNRCTCRTSWLSLHS